MCRLVFALFVSLVLVFLVGNLWLGSDKGREFLASKMKARASQSLSFDVEEAFWTPWSDLELGGVKVFSASGETQLTYITELKVAIHYGALLERKVRLRSIEVEAPLVELQESQLKGLIGGVLGEELADSSQGGDLKGGIAKGSIPGNLDPAKNGGGIVQNRPVQNGGAKLTDQSVAGQGTVVAASSTKEPAKEAKQNQPKAQGEQSKAAYRLEAFTVKGGRFVLKGDDGKALLKVDGAALRFPADGRPGRLVLKSVQVFGESVMEAAQFRVESKPGMLAVESEGVRLLGRDLKVSGLLNKRFEFSGKTQLQADQFSGKYRWGELSYDKVQLLAAGSGSLFNPKTWNLVGVVQSVKPSMRHPSKTLAFDELQMQFSLDATGVKVHELAGTGNEMRMLGSGKIALNGETHGDCRIIATADEAKNIFRFAGGLQVHFPMQPLGGASDWFFNDVVVRGKCWNPEFKSSKHWRNLKKVLGSAEGFLEREGAETLRGE